MEFISLNIEDFDPNLSHRKNLENIKLKYTDDIDTELDEQLIELFESQQRTYDGEFYNRSARDCFIIAKDEDEVVGLIFAQPLNHYQKFKNLGNNYWFINYIIVKKRYTQKSVGKKLYIACLKEIVKKGAKSIAGDFYSNKAEYLFRSVADVLGEKLTANENGFHLSFSLDEEKILPIKLEHIKNKRRNIIQEK